MNENVSKEELLRQYGMLKEESERQQVMIGILQGELDDMTRKFYALMVLGNDYIRSSKITKEEFANMFSNVSKRFAIVDDGMRKKVDRKTDRWYI